MMRMKTSFELMRCSNLALDLFVASPQQHSGSGAEIEWRRGRGAMSVGAMSLVRCARRGARGRCYNSRLPGILFSASKRVYGMSQRRGSS